MQISTKYGFAFLCMPKCASTSIESAIKEFCDIDHSVLGKKKHLKAQEFMDSVLVAHQKPLTAARIESFCLMRNPMEWIASWYRYRSRDVLKNPNHKDHNRYTGNINYERFIEEYISEGKRNPYAKINTQFNFLNLNNGKIGVDYIIPMNGLGC